MGKLLSPEEIKAKKVGETAAYLKHAEEMLSELLGPLFGSDRIESSGALGHVMTAGIKLRKMVMALRRYPLFDISCLSKLKEVEFEFALRNGKMAKVPLYVPAFGVGEYGLSEQTLEIRPAYESFYFHMGDNGIPFDSALLRQNSLRLGAPAGEAGDIRLASTCPKVPIDVKQRVEEAEPCFSQLYIAWDADWQPAPPADPLIIGEAGGLYFLVDQYDASKLERYVSSEMTTRPPE